MEFDNYFEYLIENPRKDFGKTLDEQAQHLAAWLHAKYPLYERELWQLYEHFGPELYLLALENFAMRNHDT